jgi:hypothetical protein
MRISWRHAVTLALSMFPVAAHAGLIGQAAGASYHYPDTVTVYAGASFSPAIFIIGAGQETVGNVEGVTDLLVDFSDNALTVTLNTVLSNPTWGASTFNGIIFTFSLPTGITGATVDASTTLAGFDGSRLSFTGDQILLNWQGLSYQSGQRVDIQFAFAPTPAPEPPTLALLGIALLGVAVARRRGLR